MMKQLETIYPAENFRSYAQFAMDKGMPWKVIVASPWRVRLLGKAIEFWPKFLGDNERAKDEKGFSLALSTLLNHALFHTHIYAITCGYCMSYIIHENSIEINYFYTPVKII